MANTAPADEKTNGLFGPPRTIDGTRCRQRLGCKRWFHIWWFQYHTAAQCKRNRTGPAGNVAFRKKDRCGHRPNRINALSCVLEAGHGGHHVDTTGCHW